MATENRDLHHIHVVHPVPMDPPGVPDETVECDGFILIYFKDGALEGRMACGAWQESIHAIMEEQVGKVLGMLGFGPS